MTRPGTELAPTPQISGDRLLADLDKLATFGRRPDGGIDRIAGSEPDLASRAWLAQRMRAAGLHTWTDPIGNVFGCTPASTGPRLLLGSHTDTVPAGGRLDGAYGVIAAMEALRALHEARHPAADTVDVVSFWDEEGALPTSTGGLVGSTALCATDYLDRVAAFVELHIEQGPRLETSGRELAVVEGIVGIDRHTVTFRGETNHAGTTPMSRRADAGRAAARVVTGVWELAAAVDPSMVANVGCLELVPGAPNVIPGQSSLVVEFRAATETALACAAAELTALATRGALVERCTAEVTRLSHKPVVEFDAGLCTLLDNALRSAGRNPDRLVSYAGHDASVLSAQVPTAMMFVPSTGGISHAPEEDTPAALLVRGCQALLEGVVAFHDSRVLGLAERT